MHCSVKGSCQSILKYFLQDYNYQLFYQMCVCRCPAEKPKWVFITKEAAVVYRIRSTQIGILYGSVTELSSQCIISLSQAAYVEWSCDLSQCRTHWDPLCEQLPWVVGDTKAGRRWFSNCAGRSGVLFAESSAERLRSPERCGCALRPGLVLFQLQTSTALGSCHRYFGIAPACPDFTVICLHFFRIAW